MSLNAFSAPTDFDHGQDWYSDPLIRTILRDCKTFAMVGASTNTQRPSYFAGQYMTKKGYRVIPVNPGAAGQTLFGETIMPSLDAIEEPVDLVQVFRRVELIPEVLDAVLAIDPLPKVFWLQLGIVNEDCAAKAEAAGMTVIMNRCPKIEYGRLSGELGWNGINTRVVTARKRAI